jgi:rubrerythrin
MAATIPFRPFDTNTIPLAEQYRPWNEQVQPPFSENVPDPYSKCRVILMNGIENDSFFFLHELYRHTLDDRLRARIAELRRAEVQQQTTVNWLIPPDQSILETTVSYEQMTVDLTANLAQNEPDAYAKQALDSAMIEDFDHLYRYAQLLRLLEHQDANAIVLGQTEIAEGRPTSVEHHHPLDTLRRHLSAAQPDVKTKLNYETIVAAEQQTYLYYKSHGFMFADDLARKLYAEIAEVEEEHVTQYESVPDPNRTWLERAADKQVNEAFNYFSCWQTETDPRLKAVWEQFYRMELAHIQEVGQILQQYEGKDIRTMYPAEIRPLIVLQSNKPYVRYVVSTQRNLQPVGMQFVPSGRLPGDWASYGYREAVNYGGVPSEQVAERVPLAL